MKPQNISGETPAPELAISPVASAVYQAPAIESVVTMQSLEREIFYAGGPRITNPNVPVPSTFPFETSGS